MAKEVNHKGIFCFPAILNVYWLCHCAMVCPDGVITVYKQKYSLMMEKE